MFVRVPSLLSLESLAVDPEPSSSLSKYVMGKEELFLRRSVNSSGPD
ncbi:MAG: hypothetical protein QF415_07905 [Candidatus Undinarchaeales archaeon]|jgi:hypothetical protein|nr:hypothetical protein [Candidatus Undinarchaeales archaeon]MDP7492962.1 hypothetical protein [Candidatus Undinarchaeales archaeon]